MGKSKDKEEQQCQEATTARRRRQQRWLYLALILCLITMLVGIVGLIVTIQRGKTTDDEDTAAKSTVAVTYRIDWFSNNQGCQSTTPSMTAECPRGAVLRLSTPATDVVCHHVNERVIACNAGGSGDNDNASLAEIVCYGRTIEELAIQITIHNATYECDEALGVEQMGANSVTRRYGGSVQHGVQVARLCTIDNDQNYQLWRPATHSLCSGHLQESFDDGSLETCVMEDSCHEVYACRSQPPFGCNGATECFPQLDDLYWTTSLEDENENDDVVCTQPFAAFSPLGEECDIHANCDSNTCVRGTCATRQLADGALNCWVDGDCRTGACAALTATNRTTLACCPNGETYSSGSSSSSSGSPVVCGGQPVGERCFEDEMCTTNVCLYGVCQAGLQADTEACDVDSHCQSGACGVWTTRPKGCCPSGATVEKDDVAYCTNLPIVEECEEDSMCVDDTTTGAGACARAFYSATANRVCCETGTRVSVIRPDPDSNIDIETEDYCSNLPLLEVCGSDDMCASGACGRLHYTSDDPTSSDVCCPSGESVTATRPGSNLATFKFCTGQLAGEPCGSDEMCTDGGTACARATYSASAENVCCPGGGGEVSLLKPNDPYTSDNYCTGLSLGQACGDDSMCEMGACMNGICVGESKLDDVQDCESADDCETGSCGILFFDSFAPKTCCDSGSTVNIARPYSSVVTDTYCAGLESFQMCGDHDMCMDGACGRLNYTSDDARVCCPSGHSVSAIRPDRSFLESGFCTGQPVNALCGNDDMCADFGSGAACARSTYMASADYVCCSEGRKVSLLRPGDGFATDHYCTGLSIGKSCGSDIMCQSGACIHGICMDGQRTGLQPNQGCANDDMCDNGACGRRSYTTRTDRVCCPSGNSVMFLEPNSRFVQASFCSMEVKVGAPCGMDDMCVDDAACGRASYSTGAPNICCDSKIQMLQPGSTFKTDDYCTELSLGEDCGHHNQCQSSNCEEGICS